MNISFYISYHIFEGSIFFKPPIKLLSQLYICEAWSHFSRSAEENLGFSFGSLVEKIVAIFLDKLDEFSDIATFPNVSKIILFTVFSIDYIDQFYYIIIHELLKLILLKILYRKEHFKSIN
jgi:hypothetical protein